MIENFILHTRDRRIKMTILNKAYDHYPLWVRWLEREDGGRLQPGHGSKPIYAIALAQPVCVCVMAMDGRVGPTGTGIGNIARLCWHLRHLAALLRLSFSQPASTKLLQNVCRWPRRSTCGRLRRFHLNMFHAAIEAADKMPFVIRIQNCWRMALARKRVWYALCAEVLKC